jgi:crotonobetainyl-CoA:carnitine CoA-transferase CaiB-like acyl-CoA transferase
VLNGIRVLDLTDEPGHLAGKILADLGAEVTKVEPPTGDTARGRGPYLDGREGPDRGLGWLALNTGKSSAVVDLNDGQRKALFLRMVGESDVVIETATPGDLAELGLDPGTLCAELSHLVWCSITPFGQEGPYARYSAHDLVVVAMGGNLWMTGDPEQAPVRCTMPTSTYHAAPEAVVAIVGALYARERTGRGGWIDLSMQECQVGTLLSGVGQYALRPRLQRRGGARVGRTREIWRCRDGYVSFGLRGGATRARNLIAMSELMAEFCELPDWMAAYDWDRYNHNTASEEELARLEDAYARFFATRTMSELYRLALERRILLAPCNDAREISRQEQLRSRGFFVALDADGEVARLEHPAFCARSDRPGIGVRRRAPRLGERYILPDPPPRPAPADGCKPIRVREPSGMFAGIRILEFGSGAAGPVATRYFSGQGAIVVRVESRERPDFLRTLHATSRDPQELDRSPMFVLLNPNKHSVSLDLSKPRGLEVVRELVAWADVLCENFAPGVMARWGLDAERVRAARPELIYVSSSLFGQTGPQRSYPGFGGQGAAIAGFNHLTGRPDGPAHGPYATITDSLSPRYVGALIAAALYERRRTGVGRTIDLSQIEVGVYSLSEMMIRYTANGEVVCRRANRDESAAPHGVYPCHGEDRWIAIAIMDDRQWSLLVNELPEWARAETLRTLQGRQRSENDLDRRIAEWTREQDAFALMDRLQRLGVEAGVVQTFADLLEDPQLRHRGHFQTLRHRQLGDLAFERPAFRYTAYPDQLKQVGPDLGEHTQGVLSEVLGFSPDRIAALERDGVLA